jgi:hypothetical protein
LDGGGGPDGSTRGTAGIALELKRRRSMGLPVAGQTVCIMS